MIDEWDLTATNLHRASGRNYEVGVIPVGAIEAHNRHLPQGQDLRHTTHIARRCSRDAWERSQSILCLPPLPYGVDCNLMAYPVTITVSQATLDAMLREIIASLRTHGIRKIVILNGHGGNTHVLQAALRELASKSDSFVGMAEQFALSHDVEMEIRETTEGGHACEIETSVMLDLAPEHVKMSEAKPTRIRKSLFSEGGIFFVNPWHNYTVNTGIGDPTKATADKGRRMIEASVDRFAQALKELSDAPIDDLFPYKD